MKVYEEKFTLSKKVALAFLKYKGDCTSISDMLLSCHICPIYHFCHDQKGITINKKRYKYILLKVKKENTLTEEEVFDFLL